MVYAVSIGQLARIQLEGAGRIGFGNSIDYLTADNNLRQFAELTGGAAFFPRTSQEFNAIYGRVNHELHSQYSLGYVPKNMKTDGKLRKLKVEVAKKDIDGDGKDDGLKARHKKGYFSPKK
jgi:VWFA-related protein